MKLVHGKKRVHDKYRDNVGAICDSLHLKVGNHSGASSKRGPKAAKLLACDKSTRRVMLTGLLTGLLAACILWGLLVFQTSSNQVADYHDDLLSWHNTTRAESRKYERSQDVGTHGGRAELALGSERAESDPTAACEEWLLAADGPASGITGRDFLREPVRILETDARPWFLEPADLLQRCDVGCRQILPGTPDAAQFSTWDAHTAGLPPSYHDPYADPAFGAKVVRNGESPAHYPGLAMPLPRTNISMLCSLSSDIPIPTGEGLQRPDLYDPPLEFDKKIPAMLSAISNCNHVVSFRMEALASMRALGLEVHQMGECNRTLLAKPSHDGRASRDLVKIDEARKYMFFAAFENSIYPDYVTEKVYEALASGSLPIYIGTTDVYNLLPSPDGIIHLRSLGEVPAVVKEMQRLMKNRTAYEERLAWKQRRPRPEYQALVDMQAVSRTCRLCIEIATRIQERERALADNRRARSAHGYTALLRNPRKRPRGGSRFAHGRVDAPLRPCSCPIASSFFQRLGLAHSPMLHHLYVRERGTFNYQDVFIPSDQLSLLTLYGATLSAFKKVQHVPTWKRWGTQQPPVNRTEAWGIYKLFPVCRTLRAIFFGNASFQDDRSVRTHIKENPCPLLEVIFM